ncbi:hypothetical protein GCM10027030_17160 [Luteococcus sediminum]
MSSSRSCGAITWLGVLLLLAGLGVLAWAGWQFYGTNVTSRKAAQDSTATLKQQWSAPAASAKPGKQLPGEAVALLRIPDLGAAYEWPIRVGT